MGMWFISRPKNDGQDVHIGIKMQLTVTEKSEYHR